MRVLVVDDDVGVCVTMVRMLKKLGHDATATDSAGEALEAVTGDVDVVLSDYSLSKSSGLEFLQQVREKLPHIGAAIMSGIGPRANWQESADVESRVRTCRR